MTIYSEINIARNACWQFLKPMIGALSNWRVDWKERKKMTKIPEGFPKDFYGAVLLQLIKLKVRGM